MKNKLTLTLINEEFNQDTPIYYTNFLELQTLISETGQQTLALREIPRYMSLFSPNSDFHLL